MKRTDTFTVNTRAGNGDLYAVVRVTRWLPGVIWSDLAKSRPLQFTVRYDDQTTTGNAIISALQKRGYYCAIITAFPLPVLSKLRRPLITLARQFRANPECRCRAQLLPCTVCGV